ncbi:MAG: preprotein translocase subunit YajC [Chloroflexi bacterium]|nr:preprotein translocase subunit YajC [Chloroflexota bacterium]
MIIFLVLIFAAFYFLMVRPQRRRQKQHHDFVRELTRGDRVVTAGGIYGTIESLDEDSVVLKIESGTTIRIARGSVIGRRQQ